MEWDAFKLVAFRWYFHESWALKQRPREKKVNHAHVTSTLQVYLPYAQLTFCLIDIAARGVRINSVQHADDVWFSHCENNIGGPVHAS